jgi:hypothetical protein
MKYLYATQTVAEKEEAWREFDAVRRVYPACHCNGSLRIVRLGEINKIYIKRILRDESGEKKEHWKAKDNSRRGLR